MESQSDGSHENSQSQTEEDRLHILARIYKTERTMSAIVCFGEIMTRLASPGFQRLAQALPGHLDASFAGAEANISASVALLGGKSRFVTALPRNVLGEACIHFLRGLGIDTDSILRDGRGRMAAYFIEGGAAQRPASVLYDREYSSFSLTSGDEYDWDAIFNKASWLMISGISPALSPTAAEATLRAAKEAQSRGVKVCCDLNFRAKLWQWEPGTSTKELARKTMATIVPYVDLLLTNPDQADDVLNIPWAGEHSRSAATYLPPARSIAGAYPNLKQIIFTMRESLSASHNNIGAFLYDPTTDCSLMAPLEEGEYRPFEIQPIVDRIGAGDAFAGAFLYALGEPDLAEPSSALSFAVAASCLAHSIQGDINFIQRHEIEALMSGNRSGRILR